MLREPAEHQFLSTGSRPGELQTLAVHDAHAAVSAAQGNCAEVGHRDAPVAVHSMQIEVPLDHPATAAQVAQHVPRQAGP